MSTASSNGAPSGMPAHLWELAKRDASGLMPDRLRRAADTSAAAPAPIRAFARRAAVLAGIVGAAGAIEALTAGHSAVATAATVAPLPGHLDPVPTVPGASSGYGGAHGASDGGGSGGAGVDGGVGHVSQTFHGGGGGGPTDGGLGTTWHVGVDDGSGHQAVLTVQVFQDAVVTETADGQFLVDATQVIRIVDPHGREHLFTDHYEVVVPDPPGNETDLVIHENGHVHLVENHDGSFTPVVDHDISVTTGSDGDGHDEVTIEQDEGVSVSDHDPHHGDKVDVSLSEKSSSTSDDTGDEATTTVDQHEGVDDGTSGGKHGASTGQHGDTAKPGDDGQATAPTERSGPSSGRDEPAATSTSPASAPSTGAAAAGGATAASTATAATAAVAPVALTVPPRESTDPVVSWHSGSHVLDPAPLGRPAIDHAAGDHTPGDHTPGDTGAGGTGPAHVPGGPPAVTFTGNPAPDAGAPGGVVPVSGTSTSTDRPAVEPEHGHDPLPEQQHSGLDDSPVGTEPGAGPTEHETHASGGAGDHAATAAQHHTLDHAGLG